MLRIQELRKARKMQQKELALLVGVSQPTVSSWENGTKEPTQENLEKLAAIFGVSVEDITATARKLPDIPVISAEEYRLILEMRENPELLAAVEMMVKAATRKESGTASA